MVTGLLLSFGEIASLATHKHAHTHTYTLTQLQINKDKHTDQKAADLDACTKMQNVKCEEKTVHTQRYAQLPANTQTQDEYGAHLSFS